MLYRVMLNAWYQHPWESGMDSLHTYMELLPPCTTAQAASIPTVPPSVAQRAIFPGAEAMRRSLCLARCAQQVHYEDKEIVKTCVAVAVGRVGGVLVTHGVPMTGASSSWSPSSSTRCCIKPPVTWSPLPGSPASHRESCVVGCCGPACRQ